MIRKPVVADVFYPGDKTGLLNLVNKLLCRVDNIEKVDSIAGMISPHAGYKYSGRTAAYGFSALNRNYKNVIVISPSHREYFKGSCIYEGDAFETPLGIIPVEKDLRMQLTENSSTIFSGNEGHKFEHGIEVILPFLQVTLDEFSLIPIVMGDQNEFYVDDLAAKLSAVINDDTLVIASSDLSHFYSRQRADELDMIVEKHVADFDHSGLMDDLANRKCEACGGGPIVAAMRALETKGIKNSSVLYRTDTSEADNNITEVVGYMSALFYN